MMSPKQKLEARAEWESTIKKYNLNWWGEPLDPSSGPAALAYPSAPSSSQAIVNQYVQKWHPTMPVSQKKDHKTQTKRQRLVSQLLPGNGP